MTDSTPSTRADLTAARLFERHAGIARRIAHRYLNQTGALLGPEDLLSAAQVALYDAARSYEPSRGEFTTHAWRRVQGAVVDAIRRQTPGLRDQVLARRTLRQAEDTLASRHVRAPRSSELAEELGLTQPALVDLRERAQGAQVISMDTPLDPAGVEITLHDLLRTERSEDPCAAMDRADDQAVVARAVDTLPPQERRVVTRVLLEGATGRTVAEELRVTPGRVSQILARACNHLRSNPDLRELAMAA
ncbi:MAG: sigma-70 family RNA polymerase sigma factor [Gemmatimonadales bacterium]